MSRKKENGGRKKLPKSERLSKIISFRIREERFKAWKSAAHPLPIRKWLRKIGDEMACHQENEL